MPATNPFAAPELVLAGGVVPVLVPVPAAGVLVNLVVPAVTVVVAVPEVDRTVVAVVELENLVDELRVELRPVAVAEKALQRFVPTV
jgi:predicted sugar kinase